MDYSILHTSNADLRGFSRCNVLLNKCHLTGEFSTAVVQGPCISQITLPKEVTLLAFEVDSITLPVGATIWGTFRSATYPK